MGLITRIINAFACRSECSLNEEAEGLKKFLKKLALDDLQELYEYYQARERHLLAKKKEFRESVHLKVISEI